MSYRREISAGSVYLVGAGPGDPDLITRRGLRCLQKAQVVLFDRLVHPDLLDEAPSSARRIFVGKAVGRPGIGQDGIHRLLVEHARQNRVVVRLKGGDPFIFGRGSEEALALTSASIPWEVVPAVSSAFGVPARAGIPLTHRKMARSFAVVTAHRAADEKVDWSSLAGIDTLVVLMGVSALPIVTAELLAHGRAGNTPVALISRGTLPDERIVEGTLVDIAARVEQAGLEPPATLVVGEVVSLREQWRTASLYQENDIDRVWNHRLTEALAAAV